MTGHDQGRAAPIEELDSIRHAAAKWHVASAREDMDWWGFTDWLGADPRHRNAYAEISLADSAIDDHRPVLKELSSERLEGENERRSRAGTKWMRWGGAAVAASLVAMLSAPSFMPASLTTYRTGGAAEHIVLEDGSEISLAPRSQLILASKNATTLQLTGGAWFDIRHNPGRSLSVKAGDVEISDIGTQFDVQSDGAIVRVAVASGEVGVAAPALADQIRIRPGRAIRFDRRAGLATIEDVAPEAIGSWRIGRLTYRGAALSLVAADISRYAGVGIEIAPSLREREFTGTFVLGNGEAALQNLTQIMGLQLVGSHGTYHIVEPGS